MPEPHAPAGLKLSLGQVGAPTLKAILAGTTPCFDGLIAADGALPPVHVAHRSLRLLDEGCPRLWALPFNIIDAEQKIIVGSCGFKGAPINGVVEVGYGVSASFRGRGIATWAVRCLVHRARAAGTVRAVVAHIVPGNAASEVVGTRCGFIAGPTLLDPDGEHVRAWTFPVVC